MFGTGSACSFRVGISSTTISAKFILRVGEIPATELSLQEGKIPKQSQFRILFRVREFHQRRCEGVSLGGKIPIAESDSEWENPTAECFGVT